MITIFSNEIIEDRPYAEYWLGTHSDLPTLYNGNNIKDITGELKYLFKLLTVNLPLSIQLHPNKTQGEQLHLQNPKLYPDDNHKPEMCIALSSMKLFYGFRSPEEVSDMLNQTPELNDLIGDINDLPSQLQKLYENEEVTKEHVNAYIERMHTNSIHNIYEEINEYFPGDTGIFVGMFMNYIELNPGEAVLIHPCDPHAYIWGDLIEAQATSNNVIRAGLTPKHKDVQALLRIANYENRTRPPIIRGHERETGVKEYITEYPEFKVIEYVKTEPFVIDVTGHMLGMVLEGSGIYGGEEIKAGSSYLISSSVEITPT
eukprot:CAMPEP_0202942082 /NCGR_PEP_ID=MMETSP1395-20130829/2257_1 /ASSEMBLY_ACC=CAM_ASM_000871 /TAXON_ID=5961 /ORGANISM="Blepharisma japonicum, Strain Stock R1072" /LENGTH=315 /DNA_ID=CAMNT_0049637959 /DNA_START=45 /DNA_END=988 /DNA_ORIENTATION=+